MIVRMAFLNAFHSIASIAVFTRLNLRRQAPTRTELSLNARYHDVPAGISFIGARPKTCDRAFCKVTDLFTIGRAFCYV